MFKIIKVIKITVIKTTSMAQVSEKRRTAYPKDMLELQFFSEDRVCDRELTSDRG